MAAVYPGAVRIYGSKTDLVDLVLAVDVNLLQDEVTAVETALGTGILGSAWSGTFTTPSTHTSLTTRLTNIESGLLSKQDAATAVTLTGAQTLTNKSITSPTMTGTVSGSFSVDGTVSASGSGKFSGLGAITICTSATRPGSPSAGQVIYETDTALFFGYNSSAWSSIGGGGAAYQTSAPTATLVGALWVDSDSTTSTKPAYVWNGTAWEAIGPTVPVSPLYYQATAPTSPSTGDVWNNSTTKIAQIWNGTAWEAFGVVPDVGIHPLFLIGA